MVLVATIRSSWTLYTLKRLLSSLTRATFIIQSCRFVSRTRVRHTNVKWLSFFTICYKNALKYVDDIVMKSKEVFNHVYDLRKVTRYKQYKLRMSPLKCVLAYHLGYLRVHYPQERNWSQPYQSHLRYQPSMTWKTDEEFQRESFLYA